MMEQISFQPHNTEEATNMKGCYSSHTIMEEIKSLIKEKFGNQESFGKELGASRKTISRILNHGTDIATFFKICRLLGIEGILID